MPVHVGCVIQDTALDAADIHRLLRKAPHAELGAGVDQVIPERGTVDIGIQVVDLESQFGRPAGAADQHRLTAHAALENIEITKLLRRSAIAGALQHAQ